MSDAALLTTLGFLLILTGFIVIFVAIILLLFSLANDEKKAKGGGVHDGNMTAFKSTGLKLFLAVFFLIFIGIILVIASSFASDNNVSTDIIILVGPIL